MGPIFFFLRVLDRFFQESGPFNKVCRHERALQFLLSVGMAGEVNSCFWPRTVVPPS